MRAQTHLGPKKNSVPVNSSILACVASVSVRFRSKERGTRVKDRATNGSRFISRPVKPKIPFLGLSLLRNLTETLATQATSIPVNNFRGDHLDHLRGPPDHVLCIFFVILDLTFIFHLSRQEAFLVGSLTRDPSLIGNTEEWGA